VLVAELNTDVVNVGGIFLTLIFQIVTLWSQLRDNNISMR